MELMATLQFSPGSSPINIQDQIQANRAWNSRGRRLKFQNRNPLTITIHFRTRTRTRRRCEWSLCLLPWWAHLPLSSTNQNPQLFFISFHQKVWTSLSLFSVSVSVSQCMCLPFFLSPTCQITWFGVRTLHGLSLESTIIYYGKCTN